MSENLKRIRAIVEEVFMTEINERRVAEVMEAKCTYSYLSQKYTDCTLIEISSELGLDHSTITNHINKVFPSLMRNPSFEYLANICDEKVSELKIQKESKNDRILKDYLLTKSMKDKWDRSFAKIDKKVRELNLVK